MWCRLPFAAWEHLQQAAESLQNASIQVAVEHLVKQVLHTAVRQRSLRLRLQSRLPGLRAIESQHMLASRARSASQKHLERLGTSLLLASLVTASGAWTEQAERAFSEGMPMAMTQVSLVNSDR